MEANAIDRLFAAELLKKRVDEAHRRAKADAEDYLAAKRDEEGATSLVSRYFGPGAGEYKYGRSRARRVTDVGVADPAALEAWLGESDAAARFAFANQAQFAEWWLAETGEQPAWMAVDERDEPPRATPPKIYRYDEDAVLARLGDGGSALMEANRLLLGDAS